MLKNKSIDVIEEFSNYLLGIKNLSDQYVSNIITTLKQFLTFMNIYLSLIHISEPTRRS